ncbi:MAG: hypothetical protein ACI8XV_003014, partial [Arenicella sp.]
MMGAALISLFAYCLFWLASNLQSPLFCFDNEIDNSRFAYILYFVPWNT